MFSARSLATGAFDDKGANLVIHESPPRWYSENAWKPDQEVDLTHANDTETDCSDCDSVSVSTDFSFEEIAVAEPTIVVERTERDRYGQRHPIENKTLIAQKLVAFDYEVKQLSSKAALEVAQLTCPDILSDNFKLMFLRCECFDEQKAAQRYAKYWDKRLEVFGSQRAYRPFTLESMTKEERVPLELGALNIIKRDKTNPDIDERDFLYVDPSKLQPTQYSRESGCRAFWYYIHALLEDDVTVQKKGLIVLNFCANFTSKNRDPAFARMCITSFIGCLPVRLSAYHGCHPPTLFRIVTQVLMTFIGERLRQRVLSHSGSYEHVVNVLETKYDIPRAYIPADMGGTLQLDTRAWLNKRA